MREDRLKRQASLISTKNKDRRKVSKIGQRKYGRRHESSESSAESLMSDGVDSKTGLWLSRHRLISLMDSLESLNFSPKRFATFSISIRTMWLNSSQTRSSTLTHSLYASLVFGARQRIQFASLHPVPQYHHNSTLLSSWLIL